MKSHHRWLQAEIDKWRQQGVINEKQALELTSRYDKPGLNDSWAKIVFSALGAVILGLGIILFFAYNWQAMGRTVKLLLIFTGILAAHGTGWWLNTPDNPHKKLGESLQLLGTMLFGAGIWLVAQIYHIDEYYPNGFLIWSMAALALAWVMPSIAQGLLALFLVFIWSWFETFRFHTPNHWGPWMVAGLIVPLAWIYRSRILLFFGVGLFMALYSFAAVRYEDDIIFTALFSFGCGCLGAAGLTSISRFPGSRSVLRFLGNAVYVVLLYLLTFGEISAHLLGKETMGFIAWLYWGFPVAVALLTWGILTIAYREQLRGRDEIIEAMLVIAALLTVAVSSLIGNFGQAWLFNLLFFGHALIWITRGIRTLRWQATALGGAMLAVLILARFVDLFNSLLMRSVAFIILGAALFAIGIVFSRQKKQRNYSRKQQPEEAGHA